MTISKKPPGATIPCEDAGKGDTRTRELQDRLVPVHDTTPPPCRVKFARSGETKDRPGPVMSRSLMLVLIVILFPALKHRRVLPVRSL